MLFHFSSLFGKQLTVSFALLILGTDAHLFGFCFSILFHMGIQRPLWCQLPPVSTNDNHLLLWIPMHLIIIEDCLSFLPSSSYPHLFLCPLIFIFLVDCNNPEGKSNDEFNWNSSIIFLPITGYSTCLRGEKVILLHQQPAKINLSLVLSK